MKTRIEKTDEMGCSVPETKEQAFERKKANGFLGLTGLLGCGCFLMFLPVILFVLLVAFAAMEAVLSGNY